MVTRFAPTPSKSYSRNKPVAEMRDELARSAMPGIKVIITGPPKGGIYPYRVEGCVPSLTGYADAPLLDACRRLVNKVDDNERATLFSSQGTQLCRTTVGYGGGSGR